ncbi:hypothetical protein HA402_008809 [Bradysia odoriphaga]|nr:hypothetical protein HA402_008809 [Bradysia odoriphaga]
MYSELDSVPPKCLCKAKGIACVYLNLTAVPATPPHITSLFLYGNRLELTPSSFNDLNLTSYLHLKNCRISIIPDYVFKSQKHLRRLYLNNNLLSNITNGTFVGLDSVEWLFLDSNRIKTVQLDYFDHLSSLQLLNLSNNSLNFTENQRFPNLPEILELHLEHNNIGIINELLFSSLHHLHYLCLDFNHISTIHANAFVGLTNLRELRIANNNLKILPARLFQPMAYLDVINLVGIAEENIDFNEISRMTALRAVFYDKFHFCSKTPHIQNCRPNTDGISTFSNLLDKPILRHSVWPIVGITTVGNTLVLVSRYRDENRAVSIVIRNLALADILMGFYLSIIGVQDYRFREKYQEHASDWVASSVCAAAGVLAMISSEVSLMILALMSIERFMLIAGQKRLNTSIFLLAIWLSGSALAVLPLIYWRSSNRFYGAYSGTCFPIHLEPFPLGWQYSAFVFLGINTTLLVTIATLYTALFCSIWRTRRNTPLGSLAILDCEFAIRFFFIVLTDCTCWAPIMVMKVLAFFSHSISGDVYAWLVVFVLPLNAAVNPLLYTFTTPKYRAQLLPWGWTRLTGRNLNGSGGASHQSNQAESGKVMPLLSNTSNHTSKWKL